MQFPLLTTLWVVPGLTLAAIAGCGGSKPPAQPSIPCAYTLSPSSLSFTAAGGSEAVSVNTAATCSWTAVSDRGWISITSGASGTGPGAVRVSLTPNESDTLRDGTLTIAGQTVTVREEARAACTTTITPESASFNEGGGTGRIDIIAASYCQWTAASTAAWLTLTSAAQGSGSGSVSYAVDRNRDVPGRSASITVGDRTLRVSQSGDSGACAYAVSPVTFAPCMSANYDLIASVNTQDGCTWTAQPDASWITIAGGTSGTGSGTVRFRVSDNFDRPRQGMVQVRWPTVTAGQNLQVAQAGCLYAVSTHAISFVATGASGQFNVIQASDPNSCGGPLQDACPWTAQADVPWITITTSMPQRGDNPVSFTVAPNEGTAVRIGTITVRDQLVLITQAGKAL